MRQRERCQFGVGAEDGAVRACQGFSSPVWVVSPGRLLTARLSGHQVMIDGHALSPPLSFVAAIPADPESRSKVSARSEAGTNDLDGRRSFDEANRSRRARRVLVMCGPTALSIREWMRPSWPPRICRAPASCSMHAQIRAPRPRPSRRDRPPGLGVTGFLPAAQAVHGGLQGQLRTGTTLPVERLVAAQQLPAGERPGSDRQRRGVANQSPAQGTEPG